MINARMRIPRSCVAMSTGGLEFFRPRREFIHLSNASHETRSRIGNADTRGEKDAQSQTPRLVVVRHGASGLRPTSPEFTARGR